MKTVNKHEHKLSICTDRRFLKIHEFNSFISTNIIVNKREQKQSICTDRRFLKIHEFNSFILPKTTVTLRTLYLFVFVHFICSCSCTRPWRVKCTTYFWLRTRNKLANIHYFAGFGGPRGYSAVAVSLLKSIGSTITGKLCRK